MNHQQGGSHEGEALRSFSDRWADRMLVSFSSPGTRRDRVRLEARIDPSDARTDDVPRDLRPVRESDLDEALDVVHARRLYAALS